MNFDLSEEQQMFTASVERFAAPIDVEARGRLRAMPGGYDKQRWRELAELGLIALAAPEDAGGLDGSPVDLALVAEAMGKANSPDPWLENGVLPALLLTRMELGAGADNPLAHVLSGDRIASFAWAERARRYSLEPAGTTARASGGGYVVSGEKTFVMGAAIADLFVVTAAIDGDTACFLVEKNSAGLEVRHYRLADGSFAGELKLTQIAIEESARLECGSADLETIAADARLYASAEMLGLGQRLLDDTVAYVKEREQFGVAIGSFQALQHRLVECYARIEQCRSTLYRAALTARDETDLWKRAAAGAKAFIAENVDMVAREAVQMHGGMGITDELAIGHAMKRVMVLARLFGDADTALADYAKAA